MLFGLQGDGSETSLASAGMDDFDPGHLEDLMGEFDAYPNADLLEMFSWPESDGQQVFSILLYWKRQWLCICLIHQ